MPYCVPPIVNSWSKKGAFPNTKPERVVKPITNLRGLDPGRSPPHLAQGCVPAALEVDPLEIPRAAQDPAALRDPDLAHRPGGRERQVGPRGGEDFHTRSGAA